jgi:hypothetical protein
MNDVLGKDTVQEGTSARIARLEEEVRARDATILELRAELMRTAATALHYELALGVIRDGRGSDPVPVERASAALARKTLEREQKPRSKKEPKP